MTNFLKRIFPTFVGVFLFFVFFSCVSSTKESPAVTEQTFVNEETEIKADEIQSDEEKQESILNEIQENSQTENAESYAPESPLEEEISAENSEKEKEPFVEPDLLEIAQEIAGFELFLPETIPNFARDSIEAVEDSLIEVVYKNISESSNELLLRKALGNLDITDDYNKYSYTKNVNDEGTNVLLRGKSARNINTVSWTEGDFSYAIISKTGLPQDFALSLVHQIF